MPLSLLVCSCSSRSCAGACRIILWLRASSRLVFSCFTRLESHGVIDIYYNWYCIYYPIKHFEKKVLAINFCSKMAIRNHHEAYSCLFKFIQKFPNLKLGMVISWYLSSLWLFSTRNRLLGWNIYKATTWLTWYLIYIKHAVHLFQIFPKLKKGRGPILIRVHFMSF